LEYVIIGLVVYAIMATLILAIGWHDSNQDVVTARKTIEQWKADYGLLLDRNVALAVEWGKTKASVRDLSRDLERQSKRLTESERSYASLLELHDESRLKADERVAVLTEQLKATIDNHSYASQRLKTTLTSITSEARNQLDHIDHYLGQ
jgi:septal ring factor EnvC (AmiA/AmiB activator)